MSLNWSEVRGRAAEFARASGDEAIFWQAFFWVFGLSQRRLVTFRRLAARLGISKDPDGLLWPGVLLVELGEKDACLDTMFTREQGIAAGLSVEDVPGFVLVSDRERFCLHDLDNGVRIAFRRSELPEHVRHFAFVLGHTVRVAHDDALLHGQAMRRMAALHDALETSGYTGYALEVFLVRILFCCFADDMGIFTPRDHLRAYLEDTTSPDGTDLAPRLHEVFQVLGTPPDSRSKNLDEDLAAFPFVSGHLFRERIALPSFDAHARDLLLRCCTFRWGALSPAIFGSMFQEITKGDRRRDLGVHYTSEENILKALRPLFLDDLTEALEAARGDVAKLEALGKRIRAIRVFDPACGCGNFLVVAYRELRMIELEIIRALLHERRDARHAIDGSWRAGIDVDAMVGIEIEGFSARIAETAMWLIDHQMNLLFEREFGEYRAELPLKKSARIHHGNALTMNWASVAPPTQTQYVVGNPPYVGKKRRNPQQTRDLVRVCGDIARCSELDFVACWYVKAAAYICGTPIKVAFVSTNSIVQGEQVALLWSHLFRQGIKIHFAHQTFRWNNDASGLAQVYTVIVGLSLEEQRVRRLFTYDTPSAVPVEKRVSSINAYLVEGPDVLVTERSKPLQKNVPTITFGSMPNDGGNLLLSDDERTELLRKEPRARRYIKPLLSAREYLNGTARWCLWLVDAGATELRALPEVMKRVNAVRRYRASSSRARTRELASIPALFAERRQPEGRYILIPRHSSEQRDYIPLGIFEADVIASDSCVVVHASDLFVLGVLHSAMHMAWVRRVGGRIKSDFRYSNGMVYNTFSWPDGVTEAQRQAVRDAAQAVLDVRAAHRDDTLAALYDRDVMPESLRDAHRTLDRAVDRCYQRAPFMCDDARFAMLLKRYVAHTGASHRS